MTLVGISELDITSQPMHDANRPDIEYLVDKVVESELAIIVDTSPELQLVENDMKVQQRWGLENTQEESFFWKYGGGEFQLSNRNRVGNEVLSSLFGEFNKWIGNDLVKNNVSSFKICPVYAVRI
jgi:hypothetical protein